MSDVQRYTVSGVMTPVKQDEVTTTKWVRETDYLKAIEELQAEVEQLKRSLSVKDSAS
jgi:hypothetical protein